MSKGINRPVNESAPYGGKTVYGATLGILMLETEFPRVHGDVGNAATFDFPVLYKVVPGATSYRVVREQGAGLDDTFADAARELVQIGADGVGTSCGFLHYFKANSRRRPACLWRLVFDAGTLGATNLTPGKRVGVITISSGNLAGTLQGGRRP